MTRTQLTRILRFLKTARVAVESAQFIASAEEDETTNGHLAELLRQMNHEIVRIDALRQENGGRAPVN